MDESPVRTDGTDVEAVAALAEPLRRRLYDVVAAAGEPLGREEAAARVGVAVHTARFHLDRLVADGLLEVEFRRLTGRTGPGAGRPAKLYRRRDDEVSVSLPPRHYDLLSRILATAVARSAGSSAPVAGIALEVARSEGEVFGATGGRGAVAGSGSSADELERVTGALAAGGYEPFPDSREVRLRNCPFHRAAQEQTELVCSLNLAYVEGVCAGLGCATAEPRLEPRPGHCCVVVRARG